MSTAASGRTPLLSPSQRYFARRLGWYALTLLAAITLNFVLPRLGPANPVDVIMAKLATPGMDSREYLRMYEQYMAAFDLDKPLLRQFATYLARALRGDLGVSFTHYPLSVWRLISRALPWTLALQIPALVLAWIAGNGLGALAAYRRGVFDRALYPVALFLSSVPYFCLAIVLVFVFGIELAWLPPMGAYSAGMMPSWSPAFAADLLRHYWLPFLSLVLILLGGQAIGMRSMAIYELGTDYVRYAKSLGIAEWRIVLYVVRNAMLPQLTGLALSLGLMVGGALITEIVFAYPGLGMTMFTAIRQNDYPVIQGCTLLVTVCVLAANFAVDILIGVLDPRISTGAAEGAR